MNGRNIQKGNRALFPLNEADPMYFMQRSGLE